jgi:hypothetical protein
MSDYGKYFTKIRIMSTELKNPEIFNYYYNKGFRWIRKYHARNLDSVLRYPTVGCLLEIFYEYNLDCIKIDSNKSKKLINKVCYF